MYITLLLLDKLFLFLAGWQACQARGAGRMILVAVLLVLHSIFSYLFWFATDAPITAEHCTF